MQPDYVQRTNTSMGNGPNKSVASKSMAGTVSQVLRRRVMNLEFYA